MFNTIQWCFQLHDVLMRVELHSGKQKECVRYKSWNMSLFGVIKMHSFLYFVNFIKSASVFQYSEKNS